LAVDFVTSFHPVYTEHFVAVDGQRACAQFFIGSMAFATYAVHIQKPENRLDLAFILLLTTVAFKFTVNSSLPRISYLTTMVSSPRAGQGCSPKKEVGDA